MTGPSSENRIPERTPRFGLSGKLLLLTILFVMIAEVLIYVPSIATFRLNWLNDRLAAAHTAALVLDAAPSGMVPESLARQILNRFITPTLKLPSTHFLADALGGLLADRWQETHEVLAQA